MMDISPLSRFQQTIVRSHVSNWNATQPVGRLSTEPGGQIIAESDVPIDDSSVMSSGLIQSIIVELVRSWMKHSLKLKILEPVIEAAEDETRRKSDSSSKPSANNRFKGFFSDN